MSRTNQPATTSDESRVRRLEFSVDWPPDHAAAHLVADEEPILVDAGMVGETGRQELLEGLDAHGYRPEDIEHLLLTHAHIDHVGQVRTVIEAGDPTVYVPSRVRERFERDIETVAAATRRNLAEAGLDPDSLDVAVDRFCKIHRMIREAVPLECVDVWIDDADRVEIAGREFEPIYTPGHQISHYCYGTALGGDDVVFAGDMVIEPFRSAVIHSNFDEGVTDGVDAYLEALDRLDEHSFDRVYPGHGPIHERYAETVDEARMDLEDRLEECLERLEDSCGDAEAGATAMDLARRGADDINRQVQQMREIVAVLGTLEDRDRIRSWLEDGVRYYEPV